MIVFLAALLLVYVLFLDQNNLVISGDNSQPVVYDDLLQDEQVVQNLNNNVLNNNKKIYYDQEQASVQYSLPITSSVQRIDWKSFFSTQELFETWSVFDVIDSWKILLDDTFEWQGSMQLLQLLKLEDNAKYILKDNNNTHYVYLWIYEESVSQLVESISGTYVDMSDQFTINNSQYFWTRVQKINIPSYKNNLKDISIITLKNWESWLIQMDSNTGNSEMMRLEIKARFEKYYLL